MDGNGWTEDAIREERAFFDDASQRQVDAALERVGYDKYSACSGVASGRIVLLRRSIHTAHATRGTT